MNQRHPGSGCRGIAPGTQGCMHDVVLVDIPRQAEFTIEVCARKEVPAPEIIAPLAGGHKVHERKTCRMLRISAKHAARDGGAAGDRDQRGCLGGYTLPRNGRRGHEERPGQSQQS